MSMPTAPTTGETPAPRFPDRVYPDKLQAAELALVRARRQALGLPCENKQSPADFPDNTVGFALSGGGIRSATFCLGVFQALARLGLLRRIDFLSTVSGGGYFGSFYGAWLNRGRQTVAGQPRGLVGKLRF